MAAVMKRLNCSRSLHLVPCLNCLSRFVMEKHKNGKPFCTGLLLLRTATGSNFVGSISGDFANPRSKRVGHRARALESDEKRPGSNLETDKYEESDLESDDEEEFNEAKFKTKATNSRMAKQWTKGQKTSYKTVRPSKYLFRDVRDEDEERQWRRREAAVDVKSKVSWYARQMVRLSRENQIEKAHELLYAMKEEKIQPTVEVFNILISAYAKAGKVRKAFNIFNEMKKRGLKPTCYTYSSLFTACAKSPMPEHALQRAEKVLGEINVRLSKQDLEMHSVTYNAAMHAFTVCGNPSQAFEIYKEMKERNIQSDAYTYSSLLAACCHDPVDGPRMAFHVLEEINASEIKPDIFIFNAVLKVMRDFKVFHQQQGSPSHVAEENSVGRKPVVITYGNENQFALRSEGHNGEIVGTNTNDNGLYTSQPGTTENTKVPKESVRLENFFPGVDKFLQLMAVEDVHPDVRTFQLLLYLTTSVAEEEYLLQVMENCNITPDVTFYNTLVKRKALEGDLTSAKKHMQELEEVLNVSPTEKSFQTLACGCKNHTEGLKLLEEIKSQGVTPTQAVYGTLIAGAARRRQFDYLIQLLKSMTSNEVQPNDQTIEVLYRAHKLPLKMPYIPMNAHQRVKRNQRRRYMEQKGFNSFFIHWKKKLFRVNTATPEDREAENITRKTDLDPSDEEITFDHL